MNSLIAIPMATNQGMARGMPVNLQKPNFEVNKKNQGKEISSVMRQTMGRIEVEPRYSIKAAPPMNQVPKKLIQIKIKGLFLASNTTPRPATLAPSESEYSAFGVVSMSISITLCSHFECRPRPNKLALLA